MPPFISLGHVHAACLACWYRDDGMNSSETGLNILAVLSKP